MKVIHLPIIIADNSVVISKYLKRIGVDSQTVSYFRTWLNYEADYSLELDNLNAEQRRKKLDQFVDGFLKNEAPNYDIFQFHFLDTLALGSSFGGWNLKPERGPFWDLELLKSMGKKIVFYCAGSEARNNSKVIYNQLKFLKPDLQIPAPPLNNPGQYHKIWSLLKYADALVCADSEVQAHLPFSQLISIPIDLETLEGIASQDHASSPKISLLHAPSNNLYKGTDLIYPILDRLAKEYNGRVEIRLVQNVAHQQALELYRGNGPAIDQINMSFGLFGLEAMAFERPVICSVPAGTFSKDDPKSRAPIWSVSNRLELENTLRDFIDGDNQAKAGELKAYVREHHGGDVVAGQWKDLYQSLLDGEKQSFYVNQKWYEEFDRVIRGQVVDKDGYYKSATDLLLASRDINRLLHECQMSQGLSPECEMSAKTLAAASLTGQEELVTQLKRQFGSKVNDSEFRHHFERAENLWRSAG